MGRVIVSTMVSLDGVMDAPDTWAFDLWDEEQGRWALEELLAVDALLLGRKTRASSGTGHRQAMRMASPSG